MFDKNKNIEIQILFIFKKILFVQNINQLSFNIKYCIESIINFLNFTI